MAPLIFKSEQILCRYYIVNRQIAMQKTVLLLLTLGLVAIAECRNLRIKRAPELSVSVERLEVCIEGLGCYPGEWTVVNETWVRQDLENFIAQLVEKNGVHVKDVHIINHKLDVYVYGNRTGPPPVEEIVFKPMDCQEVMEAGHNETGVYEVWPKGGGTDGRPVRVRCDMDTDGGGWTVIQRRGNFSVQENFNRNWQDYKNGFGDPSRDYWIGNDNIYALSNQGAYSARFDMMDLAGNTAYELFREFRIEDENSGYKLHISHSSGTAGDSMAHHNGRKFSTKDKDYDGSKGSCAKERKSGFWWNKCSRCNPNGVYRPGRTRVEAFYMHYTTWNNKRTESLFGMEIKLKRL